MEELRWPPNKEDLLRLYCQQKLSAAKIVAAYRLKYPNPKSGETLVLHHLRRFGIPRRDRTEHARKVTPEMVDDWARKYQGGESLKQIADYASSPVTVWNRLRKRGFSLRDKVEAQIKAVTIHRKLPFDGSEVEKAYIYGLALGDFLCVMHGRSIRVRLGTTHPAMIELF